MAAAARAMPADAPSARLPPPGVVGELADLHRAFTGLLDRLQEVHDHQRRFTGEASHQLRTPLAILLGQVEVALRRPRPPEEYERVLTLVRQQGSHLARIVEAMLFLARADGETGQLALERVDLRLWVLDYLAALADHPRAADFAAALGPDPAWVEVHPPLLRELVHNLVDNALKCSPAGTPVVIRLTGGAAFATIAVEDRGAGVADVDLPHLFEPFFRAANARQSGTAGTGLGLTVSARIAKAFGGRLTFDRLDQGACFTVWLPVPAAYKESLIQPSRLS